MESAEIDERAGLMESADTPEPVEAYESTVVAERSRISRENRGGRAEPG